LITPALFRAKLPVSKTILSGSLVQKSGKENNPMLKAQTKNLFGNLWKLSRAYWHNSTLAQKFLYVIGSLLLASMFVHSLVLGLTHGSLQGPVSFRKAITFAEAFGLACWSIGWLLAYLRLGRWAKGIIAALIGLCSLADVLIITLQVWRGVPSHFNTTTKFDSLLFILSGVAVMPITLVVAALLVLSFVRMKQAVSASLRLAIRSSLALMLVGMTAGLLMIANGSGNFLGFEMLGSAKHLAGYPLAVEPVTGGNLVAIHALGLHGMQVILLAAWLLTYTRRLSAGKQLGLTALIAVSYTVLTAMFGWQGLSGQPLSQFSPLMLGLVGLSGLALVAGFVWAGKTVFGEIWPGLSGRQALAEEADKIVQVV
jgi:hypothetical protein